MRKIAIFGFVLLLGAALAGAADVHKVLEQNQPPVVRQIDTTVATWITQPPNGVNGIFSDVGCDLCGGTPQVIADNFIISTGGVGVNMNQAVMWGGYFPSNVPVPADFEVLFHSNAGGLPGAVVCQYTVTPTSDVLTGVTLFGVSEHLVTLDFSDCTLADGTYWIEIYTATGLGTDDWFWETGDQDPVNGIFDGVVAFEAPGVSWAPVGYDFAFTLNGDLVPVELQSFDVE